MGPFVEDLPPDARQGAAAAEPVAGAAAVAPTAGPSPAPAPVIASGVDWLSQLTAEVERRKLEQALRAAGPGNKPKAAEMLQISVKALLAKQREYGLGD